MGVHRVIRSQWTYAAAAEVVVLGTTAVWARRQKVSLPEEWVFRRMNEAPDAWHGKVWTVMQYGSFAAVPAVGSIVGLMRGWRRGGVVGAAGTTSWLAGKVIKSVIGRGRPADHLDEVIVRGSPQTGLGFPSGHASVAMTLAITSTVGARPAAVVGAVVAAGGRVYVGAHLPLDVVAGLALGGLVGAAANSLANR